MRKYEIVHFTKSNRLEFTLFVDELNVWCSNLTNTAGVWSFTGPDPAEDIEILGSKDDVATAALNMASWLAVYDTNELPEDGTPTFTYRTEDAE